MTAIAEEFPDMSADEVFSRSVWVCNAKDLYRGFSPLQHASGRTPDENMRMFESTHERPVNGDIYEDGGFGQNIRAMCLAEKAFIDEQARNRLQRAQMMGQRRLQVFQPGDLVFYWRRQQAGRDHRNFPRGRYLGPARVIATETRVEEDGSRPGSVVWLHRGGHLLRAAPEQLRLASAREQYLEEMQGAVELPWTITKLATDPRRRTYINLEEEGNPDEMELAEDAEQPDVPRDSGGVEHGAEGQARHRISMKRPPRDPVPGEEPAKVPRPPSSTSARPRSSRASSSGHQEMEWDQSAEIQALFAGNTSNAAVEIEVEMPTTKRGIRKFAQNPCAYIAQKLKTKQAEVHERQLDPDEFMKFQKAEQKEVHNFIAAECFRTWQGRDIQEHEILGMRWLLSWKYDEKYKDEGGRKAKARAIILGYQDHNYQHRETSAPTPSKSGRQLYFQMAAWKRFKVEKGDISGAFLQGDDLEEDMWCRPLPEICKELGIAEGTPMLMKKAAYGLVQAPLHWVSISV